METQKFRPLESIPTDLHTQAAENLEKLRVAAENASLQWPQDEGFLRQILILFSCSPFAARFSIRYPELLLGEESRLSLTASCGLENYRGSIAAVFDNASESQIMSGLRYLRQKEMIRIAWRDLLGLAETRETLRNLSELAESFVDLTLEYCYRDLSQRFGVPRNKQGVEQKLIVIGMGKLGGMELNYSSDIDLILAFPEAGTTDGRKQLDITDFYRRVIQQFVRLLNESTADGFVFRVDLRLRPFGNSGPIAMAFDAMEAYYQTQGREWERYAMIKARVVSGDEHNARQLFEFLRPFVFRRYLDYSAFESLRALKSKISLQVQRKGMQNNIKLGAGGIREIEFIGQAFQLVRGGKETELQQRGILTVLKLLAEKKYLADDEVKQLLDAYDFLRRTENRLQMVQDQQTHVLPEKEPERIRLAFSMGLQSWKDFSALLSVHRENVQSVFEAVFKLENDTPEGEFLDDQLSLLWSGDMTEEEALAELSELGYTQTDALYEQLRQLGQGGYYSRLTNIARERLDTIIPIILRAAAKTNDPDEIIQRLLGLLRNIAGRSVYVQVLIERPQSIELLVRLFGASKWLSDFVSAYPMVIDEILDHRLLQQVPDEAALEDEMKTILQRVENETLDIQMDAVRQFKQANMMRVAAADLEGLTTLKEVSNHLTAVAETVLRASCNLVWAEMVKRYGNPGYEKNGERHCPEFAVVAYGKLGGLELGYGSDLDIVFLHNSEGEKQQSDGDKPLDNTVFFARMAQKAISFLSTKTPAGTLYEIDTRLRPNGQSGMLVSSLQAFETYQKNNAWTWEHQALVRARVVVGGEAIKTAFEQIRHDILSQPRDQIVLLKDVVTMRERMYRELNKAVDGEFDLKQDRGGIVDIEFMVQYSVLAQAGQYPQLMVWTDNLRLLETLAEVGFLSKEEAERAIEIYFTYREFTHLQALQGKKIPVLLDESIKACQRDIQEIWNRVMAG